MQNGAPVHFEIFSFTPWLEPGEAVLTARLLWVKDQTPKTKALLYLL
jgi:hypothetical protein